MPSVNRKVIVNPPKSLGSASDYTRAIGDEASQLVVSRSVNPIQAPLLRLYRTPILASFTNKYNPFTPTPWTGGSGGGGPAPTPDIPLDQRTINWNNSPLTGPFSDGELQGLAMSSDGTIVYVAQYGGSNKVYKSTNSGVSFTELTGYTTGNWYDICTSEDGQVVFATNSNTRTNTILSIDGGSSWSVLTAPGSGQPTGCACSADGTKFLFADYSGYLYVGTRTGTTISWVQQTSPGIRAWREVAMSADGSVMLAGDNVAGNLWTYSSGSWKIGDSPTGDWGKGVACSGDGSILLAGRKSANTPLYTSTNGGVNWVAVTPIAGIPANSTWSGLACSYTGIGMVACTTTGPIYTSVDRGVTWKRSDTVLNGWNSGDTNASQWYSAVTSRDGTKIVLTTNGSGKYARGVYV